MRNRGARIVVGFVSSAAMLGLLTVSGALASPPQASFELRGSHGYAITGFGTDTFATLTAGRGPGQATYSAPTGRGTARVMKFDLGSVGEFDLEFHSERTRMVSPPEGCRGEQAKKKIGTWKGRIKFDGEDGYTSVDAREASGSVLFPERWRCPPPRARRGTQLTAIGGMPPPAPTMFTAFRPKAGSKSRFFATASDSIDAGRVTIGVTRVVTLTGPASAFTFDADLTSAHIGPPGPFNGGADFASPYSWAGSLNVNFPGAKHVMLTGVDWGAGLDEGSFFDGQP